VAGRSIWTRYVCESVIETLLIRLIQDSTIRRGNYLERDALIRQIILMGRFSAK